LEPKNQTAHRASCNNPPPKIRVPACQRNTQEVDQLTCQGPNECPKEQIDCPNTQIVSPFLPGVLNLAAMVLVRQIRATALPHGIAGGWCSTRTVLGGRSKHGACLVNAVAGVQQPLDVLIVFRPLLDLEEVALVGESESVVVSAAKLMSCAIAAGCGLAGASQSHCMLRVAREGRGQGLWKVAAPGESGAHATQFQSCSASRFTAGAAGFLTP
jgi:hypothetical protein